MFGVMIASRAALQENMMVAHSNQFMVIKSGVCFLDCGKAFDLPVRLDQFMQVKEVDLRCLL